MTVIAERLKQRGNEAERLAWRRSCGFSVLPAEPAASLHRASTAAPSWPKVKIDGTVSDHLLAAVLVQEAFGRAVVDRAPQHLVVSEWLPACQHTMQRLHHCHGPVAELRSGANCERPESPILSLTPSLLEEEEEFEQEPQTFVLPATVATKTTAALAAPVAPGRRRRFSRQALFGSRCAAQDAFVVATILGRCRADEPHEPR